MGRRACSCCVAGPTLPVDQPQVADVDDPAGALAERPRRCPGARRSRRAASRRRSRLIHQKPTGTTERFSRSLTSRWRSMRPVNRIWPTKPRPTHSIPTGAVMLRAGGGGCSAAPRPAGGRRGRRGSPAPRAVARAASTYHERPLASVSRPTARTPGGSGFRRSSRRRSGAVGGELAVLRQERGRCHEQRPRREQGGGRPAPAHRSLQRGRRSCSQRTPRASRRPRKARSRVPYLLRPVSAGRGAPASGAPCRRSMRTRVGRKRCMPLNTGPGARWPRRGTP